jgi:tryptophanyl-tRNA synthetase
MESEHILSQEQTVTPWEVEAADDRGVDYDKLIKQFGTRKIDQALLDRFETLTGTKPHRYLRRGLFFSHRFNHTHFTKVLM